MKARPRIGEVLTRRHIVDISALGLANPRFAWTEKTVLLVFVVTEAGETGVGECWATGASVAAVEATVRDDIAPLLLGEDPRLVERHWRAMFAASQTSGRPAMAQAAIAGVDIALWDLLGKLADMPCHVLLGGARERVSAYASAGLYGVGKTVDDLAEEARGYRAKGFAAMKLKVGAASLGEDVARVAAVREAMGPEGNVMMDAMCAMRPAAAARLSEAVRALDVAFFEQPVHHEDFEAMRRLDAGPVPVAGNENMASLLLFREMIERRAVTFVQPELLIVGGITAGRCIAAMAAARHLPVTLHHSSSVVSMAANLHFAAGQPSVESVEFHQIHQYLFDRVPAGMFAVVDGMIRIPDRAGLGIDLSPDDFSP